MADEPDKGREAVSGERGDEALMCGRCGYYYSYRAPCKCGCLAPPPPKAQVDAEDVERAYGAAGRAAGEAVLEHGLDGARRRPANDAFLLSRIARACTDAVVEALQATSHKGEACQCSTPCAAERGDPHGGWCHRGHGHYPASLKATSKEPEAPEEES